MGGFESGVLSNGVEIATSDDHKTRYCVLISSGHCYKGLDGARGDMQGSQIHNLQETGSAKRGFSTAELQSDLGLESHLFIFRELFFWNICAEVFLWYSFSSGLLWRVFQVQTKSKIFNTFDLNFIFEKVGVIFIFYVLISFS